MMDHLLLPCVLQFAGVLVIIAEIILPSGGLLSIIAAGLLGYSLYSIFLETSVATGMVFVVADVIIIPIINRNWAIWFLYIV